MSPMWWSFVLMSTFLVSQLLLVRRSAWGWVVGIVDEVLWIVYGAMTGQWWFLVSAAVYAGVCVRGLRQWRQPNRGRCV